MTPSNSYSNGASTEMAHAVRSPRASDGVGNALRQVFSGQPSLPQDLASLLAKLSCD